MHLMSIDYRGSAACRIDSLLCCCYGHPGHWASCRRSQSVYFIYSFKINGRRTREPFVLSLSVTQTYTNIIIIIRRKKIYKAHKVKH